MYMCPKFCGICKPKRFPVFPRKRSDLLQMLLYRLLMPLRIFRFCVVLHRCLLRSRFINFIISGVCTQANTYCILEH